MPLEAIRGDLTLAELAAKHGVHHKIIAAWKRQAIDGLARSPGRAMVEAAHSRLSISAQCRLLRMSHSSYYYAPVPETDETLALMTVIDETCMECPWYGNRQMTRHLRRDGRDIGRRRVRCLMAKIGLTPLYQLPRSSDPHPQTGSSRISCASWRSSDPTTSGVPESVPNLDT